MTKVGKSTVQITKKTDKKGDHVFISVFKEHLPKQIVFICFMIIFMILILMNLNNIGAFIVKVVNILMPIIVGLILAYLVCPIYNGLVTLITKRRERYQTDKSKLAKFAKMLATILCMCIVILVAVGLIFLFVPQLYTSIVSFAGRAEGYLDSFSDAVANYKENSSEGLVREFLTSLEKAVEDMIVKSSDLGNVDFSKIFVGVYNGFSVSLKVILNAFVGLVVMIYVLNMKTELCTGVKRILYALFPVNFAKKVLVEVRYAHKVFSGFLIGKILDSLIIGVLCYICCLIMQMPYTPLISVIVGITNIIPFFGPFIGAIPSFIIIFLDQPLSWRPYGFILFIFALQQLDGNVIGPKILGDKTGVGSFWVLFSILLFGGLFGFVGMIIAVPLWAIITRLFDEFIVNKLKAKNQPLTVEDYAKLKGYEDEFNKA